MSRVLKDIVFLIRFESKAHVNEYVTLIDSLVQQAKERVFANQEALENNIVSGTCPTVDTSNGIRIMYSIVEAEEGMKHHFSISCTSYLPTRYAKHLTALFCHLSGLALPEVLCRSERNIYHVGYVLSRAEQQQFQAYVNPKRHEPKEIFKSAFMDSIPIQIESMVLHEHEMETG